jgi:CHRD domain-containing protein
MTQTKLLIVGTTIACLVIGSARIAGADSDTSLRARLTGFQQAPAILSNGTGVFTASVSSSSLTYSLTFSNLSSSAAAAHIHFGQRGLNGAVVVFFCGGGGKPACPAGGGTVTGTVTAADVLGVPAQGVTAGSFADLLRILRSGDAYVNVHTTNFPGGEIRGQISQED